MIQLGTRAMIENCVTLALMSATILGLYAMGAGGFSAIGLLFFLNIQYVKVAKP